MLTAVELQYCTVLQS